MTVKNRVGVPKKRSFKISESQRRLLQEVEKRHRNEMGEILRVIQKEVGFDSKKEKTNFLINKDRTAFEEILPKEGGDD